MPSTSHSVGVDPSALPGFGDIWLHSIEMGRFREHPVVVDEGDGIYLHTVDGRTLVDGTSAAMVTSLGYSNKTVLDAIAAQARRLPFGPVLHGTSDAALELAHDLQAVLPGDLGRVFLLSGGSEATETAVKMARQYHLLAGRPEKRKIVARYGAYHGATNGALSISGLRYRSLFAPLMPEVVHVPPPNWYGEPGDDGQRESEGIDVIERTLAAEGRNTVAAVIVDPVMAAAGMIVPSDGYYRALREICGDDVLLIFDEVLTGFGRTGNWFAADHYGVVPDIICLGKGISAGYAPLAATVARPHVAEQFESRGRMFQHIHTSGGNPISAAAGSAVIREISQRDLVGHARDLGADLIAGLRRMTADIPAVGDVRGLGMLVGLDLVDTAEGGLPFATPMAPRVVEHALRHEDLLIRSTRDVVQIAPPLITTPAELDEILARVERSLLAVLGERRPRRTHTDKGKRHAE